MSGEGTSPTARALRALEAIQRAPGITAGDLAAELGVTERAARRYVAILREADIPVLSTRGRYGGYRVGRGVRLPPLLFSDEEALGLVMAVLDGHHAAGDPDEPVGSALGKIVRALPQPIAAQAEAIRRTAAPAPDRGAARPAADVTAALVQACSAGRRVEIDYRTHAGSAWTVVVDPWTVVVRHGRWYLLCHVVDRDVHRTYRLDRMPAVRVLDAPITHRPPADLDAVAMLEEHLALGWDYEVETVIDAPADAVARRLPRTLGRVTPLDDEHCLLSGSTSEPEWYAGQLTVLPVPYRITGSPEVRAAALEIGRRLVAAATEPDPHPDPH